MVREMQALPLMSANMLGGSGLNRMYTFHSNVMYVYVQVSVSGCWRLLMNRLNRLSPSFPLSVLASPGFRKRERKGSAEGDGDGFELRERRQAVRLKYLANEGGAGERALNVGRVVDNISRWATL